MRDFTLPTDDDVCINLFKAGKFDLSETPADEFA
jgi:hypothetical protein